MNIEALISKLEALKTIHGKDIEVLINHTSMIEPQHIPADNGCPAYISLESE
ncbi:hypothetical protein [Oryzomonas sagensis]|uniref:hypothetical protein n=1 Tax=Oryzomonas sagensis TaxID=2603857 RepID=UPI00177AB66E|nr:hypothetical protein [Oryzomonas sagensis]